MRDTLIYVYPTYAKTDHNLSLFFSIDGRSVRQEIALPFSVREDQVQIECQPGEDMAVHRLQIVVEATFPTGIAGVTAEALANRLTKRFRYLRDETSFRLHLQKREHTDSFEYWPPRQQHIAPDA